MRTGLRSAPGSFPATINTPDRFAVHEVGEAYVLGIWSHELDVPFVPLYRLIGGQP